MTTSTVNNGRVSRKSLSSQIDRLDATLDGLADNLNEAVALAVKDVVGQVVREALEVAVKEVLAKPELLRAALAQHAPVASVPPAAPVQPKRRSVKEVLKDCWNWLWNKTSQIAAQVNKGISHAWTWCLAKMKKIYTETVEGVKSFTGRCVNLCGKLASTGRSIGRFWKPLVIALSAGVVVGVGSYWAGPLVASVGSGMAGFMGSLAASALSKLRRMLPFLAVSES